MSEQKKNFDEFEDFSLDDFQKEDRELSYEEPMMDEMFPSFEEEPDYATPAQETEEEEFVPDFGDAFDDYGEYKTEEDYALEEAEQKPRRKKRIVPLYLKVLIYIVVVALVSVGIGYGAWECAQDVLALGRSDELVQVSIKQGNDLDDIAQMLKDKGIIKYPWLFKLYCRITDSSEKMDVGTYELYYNYDYHALVNGMRASSPNRSTVRVMIPEGRTCAQIFALMEKNGVCTAKELEECAAKTEFDYWFLADIPYGETNRLEGFLFPDTYDFYVGDDPERVINKLLSNFNRKFSEEAIETLEELNADLAERLGAQGYDETYIEEHRFTVYELITVASMIEKETAAVRESATIASVIYNRLCKPGDYPYLNIDATVVYALGGAEGGLTYEDLEIDSPYNTYNHAGLPAGPISNPGLSSITAALKPADTNYYYYALDKAEGLHHFSKTYSEHQKFLEAQSDEE